jgi:hypothetical protein
VNYLDCVKGTRTVKTNNEKKNLNLNPNTKCRNQDKSQDIKYKNMRCAKQKCKKNYIVIKYENVNTKETK